MKQYATVGDTVYFWFAANDTSGSGGDGASPAADIRLAGAAADAAPVYSPTPSLLSHTNYPAGAHEIAIAATVGNGFAVNNTYGVFCTLLIDSQNPTGFVGSFDLKPIESNLLQIGDTAQSATDLKDFTDSGYDPSAHKIETCKVNDDMVGTANAALASICTEARLGHLDADITTRSSHSAANVWSVVTRTLTDKTGYALSAAGVDAILDEVVEGTTTFRQMLRIFMSALSGKSSGGGTVTLTFRDIVDGKNRITATVDANGNRTAMTLDGA